MGRSKPNFVPFPPWETLNTNGREKKYVRMGITLMNSIPVKRLSGTAFKIMTYMKKQSGQSQQFEFPRTEYIQITTEPTFNRAIKELIGAGIIDVVERNRNLRKPNVYSWSLRWKNIHYEVTDALKGRQ